MKYPTWKIIRDYGITVAIAVGLSFLIRTYLVEAYRIPSLSMKPSLIAGDTIFVTKWPYMIQKKAPEKGDIVVFSNKAASNSLTLTLIKRVVGTPGDQIALKQGLLILNGRKISQKSLLGVTEVKETLPNGKTYFISLEGPPLEDFGPEKIPEGSVFVLGDLRAAENSKKFNSWGLIPISSIKGKAVWIWLSIVPRNELINKTSLWPKFRLDRMFEEVR